MLTDVTRPFHAPHVLFTPTRGTTRGPRPRGLNPTPSIHDTIVRSRRHGRHHESAALRRRRASLTDIWPRGDSEGRDSGLTRRRSRATGGDDDPDGNLAGFKRGASEGVDPDQEDGTDDLTGFGFRRRAGRGGRRGWRGGFRTVVAGGAAAGSQCDGRRRLSALRALRVEGWVGVAGGVIG